MPLMMKNHLHSWPTQIQNVHLILQPEWAQLLLCKEGVEKICMIRFKWMLASALPYIFAASAIKTKEIKNQ